MLKAFVIESVQFKDVAVVLTTKSIFCVEYTMFSIRTVILFYRINKCIILLIVYQGYPGQKGDKGDKGESVSVQIR